MKFETVRIYFLSDVLICCHPEILLPWQRDVTTFPLYHAPLFAIELEKLLVNDKITASCQTNMSPKCYIKR